MLSREELNEKYGDVHLELTGVQGNNVFLKGFTMVNAFDSELIMVHFETTKSINSGLIIKTKPKHLDEPYGINLKDIYEIESVYKCNPHTDDEKILIYKR